MNMELKSPSLKSGGLVPPDCVSDPDEKEISDDDDDDRNHKHRRRETRSQSLERDLLEQPLSHSYRKRSRTFENGQSDPQSHYGLDRDFTKFEKRRPPGVNFSRFPSEYGSGRGRGRDFQRDSRFGTVDVASQMGHPGSFQSAMFTGRGLPNVPSAQSASWSGFGLLPAIPNGAIDAINPLGLPGILRPQLNSSLNMGIQRQRCRDFEERGFCLRGDMCPMEHGVNRIVIEDVQSLSQFNLPVSLSSAHVLGTSAGSGFMPSAGVSSSTMMNSRGIHSKTSKSAFDDESLASAAIASGADVYDPDQPLWNNDSNETSTPLRLQPPNFDESEPFMDADLSDRVFRSSGAGIGSQSTSATVWGRLNNSKNKLELKEKFDSRTKPSEYPESKSKEIREASISVQGTSHLGKQNNGGPFGMKVVGSTSKMQIDAGANSRKPSQKAQRTLFVNCIPLKDNKRENLLSHFRKFGEVIDIYIPANSERAFVQFSKREEAERALKAPDAVMGSRFIKLWWANRDSIVDEGTNSGNSVITPQGVPAASGSQLSALNKGKDNVQHAAIKVAVPKTPASLATVGHDYKPTAANSPKMTPPVQKKMENLEVLREELRKKQEMLEQRRIEFRRQLEKLAKQATGVKGEVSTGQASKEQTVETATDLVKTANAKSANANVSGPLLKDEVLADKTVNIENIASQRSITNSAGALDPSTLKQAVRPMATSAIPFSLNRYKLDNRPTTFRINAPLPFGLANVVALRDHFSMYGAVSNVEIEDSGEEEIPKDNDSEAMKHCSARVSFATRQSAERAFLNGKSWDGYNLQFSWITSSIPSTSRSSGESSSALKGILNVEVQSEDKTKLDNSQSALGHKESNSSPCKSSNELSGDSSRSNGKVSSPAAAVERDFIFEVQSPDKSANYIPLETAEPEDRGFKEQEEEDSFIEVDEDLRISPKLLAEERLA
ncbi:zinc finger CCCH domain-containing protein 41-like [Chenopodium quinoa]|uniref:zinc finger CCCH domain-containing protein 41-like n=1 Tax=Chenopodium quinoa TaxID=63459 RepID=UPI000B78165E|nr:zinc finger CCCH domain-containing protein 41-like [Chenopodium quinoa]